MPFTPINGRWESFYASVVEDPDTSELLKAVEPEVLRAVFFSGSYAMSTIAVEYANSEAGSVTEQMLAMCFDDAIKELDLFAAEIDYKGFRRHDKQTGHE